MNRKTILYVFIIFIATPIMIIGWNVYFSIQEHNHDLMSFEKSFSLMQHPPMSTCVYKFKEVGLLLGNGSHCDFLVGEIRETKLSSDEIVKFYMGKEISDVTGKSSCHISVAMYDIHGEITNDYHIPYNYRNLKDVSDIFHKEKKYYIIYAYDISYPASFDLRCY